MVKGNLFKQIFKEGNFWTPKMQRYSTAYTLIECGSFCVADKVICKIKYRIRANTTPAAYKKIGFFGEDFTK